MNSKVVFFVLSSVVNSTKNYDTILALGTIVLGIIKSIIFKKWSYLGNSYIFRHARSCYI